MTVLLYMLVEGPKEVPIAVGDSLSDLARHTGRSISSLMRSLQRSKEANFKAGCMRQVSVDFDEKEWEELSGGKKMRGPRPVLTNRIIEQLICMQRQGKTTHEMGAVLGVAQSTICKWMRRAGIRSSRPEYGTDKRDRIEQCLQCKRETCTNCFAYLRLDGSKRGEKRGTKHRGG